jgi:hypothetical protein
MTINSKSRKADLHAADQPWLKSAAKSAVIERREEGDARYE